MKPYTILYVKRPSIHYSPVTPSNRSQEQNPSSFNAKGTPNQAFHWASPSPQPSPILWMPHHFAL